MVAVPVTAVCNNFNFKNVAVVAQLDTINSTKANQSI